MQTARCSPSLAHISLSACSLLFSPAGPTRVTTQSGRSRVVHILYKLLMLASLYTAAALVFNLTCTCIWVSRSTRLLRHCRSCSCEGHTAVLDSDGLHSIMWETQQGASSGATQLHPSCALPSITHVTRPHCLCCVCCCCRLSCWRSSWPCHMPCSCMLWSTRLRVCTGCHAQSTTAQLVACWAHLSCPSLGGGLGPRWALNITTFTT
jgi:hypothetical protein